MTLTTIYLMMNLMTYRVLYVPKAVNKKGQADKVIEFIPANSPEAEGLNKQYVLVKEREKRKYLPGDVYGTMQKRGYKKFNAHFHTLLWKEKDAKNQLKGFGTQIAKTWYWYDNWMQEVEKHCKDSGNKYQLTV